MYAVTFSFANSSARPSVTSYTRPRHVNSSKTFVMKRSITIQAMAVTRRAVLKTVVAAAVGAAAGAGTYGFVYGRRALELTRATVPAEGLPPSLGGLRLGFLRDIASLVRGAAPMSILLAHDPRRLTEAAGLGVPLVLSGHTHGGQVVLPVVGAVAAQKFPVVAGLARRDRTTIFVSRGVGTVYVPVRINCPPEVAILTLTRSA